MNNVESKWNVNFFAVALFSAMIVLDNGMTKIFDIKEVTAWKGYFSYSEFLYSYPHAIPLSAILVQIAIPIVVGMIIALFPLNNATGIAKVSGALGVFWWYGLSLGFGTLRESFTQRWERKGMRLFAFLSCMLLRHRTCVQLV